MQCSRHTVHTKSHYSSGTQVHSVSHLKDPNPSRRFYPKTHRQDNRRHSTPPGHPDKVCEHTHTQFSSQAAQKQCSSSRKNPSCFSHFPISARQLWPGRSRGGEGKRGERRKRLVSFSIPDNPPSSASLSSDLSEAVSWNSDS